LVQGDRRVTWRDFDDRAARLAAAFTAAGLTPGSKVASYLYNSNEYSEGVYATFKMRGVPANVNYRYLEDELAYLIDNSDAEALLFHGELGDRVAKVVEQSKNVKAWIQVDDGAPLQDFAIGYEELLAASAPMPRIERSGDDRRRCVRQADGARARRGGVQGHALRHLVGADHHQLRRDVVDGDQAGVHEPREHHLLRLARIERRRGFCRLDQRARFRTENC